MNDMKNECECNRCELGSAGHYTQWTCEYTGEYKTDDDISVCQGACKGDTCVACGCCECYHDARVCQWTEEQTCILTAENMHTHDDCSLHEHEWTEDGTDGMVTARVTLQIVIDVPDGKSIGEAVQQMVKCCPYFNAYCVEILLSEPTNLSASELYANENQSYLNRLSNTKQGDEN